MNDILILNGKIISGIGNPWFYGDLAIVNDKIVKIGRGQEGAGHGVDRLLLGLAVDFDVLSKAGSRSDMRTMPDRQWCTLILSTSKSTARPKRSRSTPCPAPS